MTDLTDLYQEVILDHNRRPRNFGVLEGANRTAEGLNPLCGDSMTVYLQLRDGLIQDIRYQAEGCAISKASASLMTESVKGKKADEAEAIFQEVHKMLTGGPDADSEALGKLAVLEGVRQFPVRIKCASLGWHALRSALRGEGGKVSTE